MTPNEQLEDLLSNIAASPSNDEEIDALRTVIRTMWDLIPAHIEPAVIVELSDLIETTNTWKDNE